MTTPFQPNLGDTIEFYNSEAELWEPGTVFSHGADRRHYFINPDDENQPMHVVDYTNIRPLTDTTPDEVPSFWEAAKRAVRQRNAWLAVATEDAARAEKAEREVSSLKERQSSIADERDMWMRQAVANSVNIGKLRAQIDAFPYETGAPVGDRVAARISEYRERAEKAEIDRDYWKNRAEVTHLQHVAANKRADDAEDDRDGWVQEANDNEYISRIGYDERDKALARAEKAEVMAEREAARAAKFELVANAADARIEELEDQNRQLKSVLDTTNEDVRNARLRAGKHAAELGEIKAALRTLAGER